jgi:DedD protein
VAAALLLLLAVLWYEDSDSSSKAVRRPVPVAGVGAGVGASVVIPTEILAATVAAEAAEAESGTAAESDVPVAQEAGLEAVLIADATAAGKVGEVKATSATSATSATNATTEREIRPIVSAASPPRSGPYQIAAPAGTSHAQQQKQKEPSRSDGYWLQLGVFDGMDNAERLLDNATELGLPAQLQARVMVGPFRSKGEADAAMKRLKGVSKGIVLPPQKPKKAVKSRRRAN